jgi:hypothetical protein
MEPGIYSCQASGKHGTYNEDGAEQLQHTMKINHGTLPLVRSIVTEQTKNELKWGSLSTMECPFADNPEWHKKWRSKGRPPISEPYAARRASGVIRRDAVLAPL